MNTIDIAPIPIESHLRSLGDSAFGKALAATIMAWFPITSIIAIFMGSKALKIVGAAYTLAEQNRVRVTGKCKAARVLGMIGKIGGIVMTVFWILYGIYLIIYFIISVVVVAAELGALYHIFSQFP